MENSEVSEHEVAVHLAMKGKGWMTVKEVAAACRVSVAPRTVARHIKRHVDLGLVDLMEVYPGHRYRISEKADKRNKTYLQRLTDAIPVLFPDAK